MSLKIELSQEAERDLEEIFDYTLTAHGVDKAEEYVSSFDAVFDTIIQHPEIGRSRGEIRMGLRSVVKDLHVIFYRIVEDHIRIVRILHRARDIPFSL